MTNDNCICPVFTLNCGISIQQIFSGYVGICSQLPAGMDWPSGVPGNAWWANAHFWAGLSQFHQKKNIINHFYRLQQVNFLEGHWAYPMKSLSSLLTGTVR